MSSAHRSAEVVGAHIKYSTFPSGRACTEAARLRRFTMAFVAVELYPPPPAVVQLHRQHAPDDRHALDVREHG